jgi:hypothetical protein
MIDQLESEDGAEFCTSIFDAELPEMADYEAPGGDRAISVAVELFEKLVKAWDWQECVACAKSAHRMWITIAFENWYKTPLDLPQPSMGPGDSCEAEDHIRIMESWDSLQEEPSQNEKILFYLTSEHDTCLGVFLDRMEKLAFEVEVPDLVWSRFEQERLKPLSDLLDVQFLSLVNELGIARIGRVSDRARSTFRAVQQVRESDARIGEHQESKQSAMESVPGGPMSLTELARIPSMKELHLLIGLSETHRKRLRSGNHKGIARKTLASIDKKLRQKYQPSSNDSIELAS